MSTPPPALHYRYVPARRLPTASFQMSPAVFSTRFCGQPPQQSTAVFTLFPFSVPALFLFDSDFAGIMTRLPTRLYLFSTSRLGRRSRGIWWEDIIPVMVSAVGFLLAAGPVFTMCSALSRCGLGLDPIQGLAGLKEQGVRIVAPGLCPDSLLSLSTSHVPHSQKIFLNSFYTWGK